MWHSGPLLEILIMFDVALFFNLVTSRDVQNITDFNHVEVTCFEFKIFCFKHEIRWVKHHEYVLNSLNHFQTIFQSLEKPILHSKQLLTLKVGYFRFESVCISLRDFYLLFYFYFFLNSFKNQGGRGEDILKHIGPNSACIHFRN